MKEGRGGRLRLAEAWLVALAITGIVLLEETVVLLAVHDLHAVGLRVPGTLARVIALTAAAQIVAASLAWLIGLIGRRREGGRAAGLLVVLAWSSVPVALYPFLLAMPGSRPLRFSTPTVAYAVTGLLALTALLLAFGPRLRGARWMVAATLLAALAPLGAATVALRSFLLTAAPGRPLALEDPRLQGAALLGAVLLGLAAAWAARPAGAAAARCTAAAVLPLVLLVACVFVPRSGGDPLPPSERTPVLWIVVDTLRADHVPGSGGDPDRTPNLARLSRDSVAFSRCSSTAPWTVPSFGSMFTSTYPEAHRAGARFGGPDPSTRLHSEMPTLAHSLSEAGYRTSAILTNFSIQMVPELARGFGVYANSIAPLYYHDVPAWVMTAVLGERATYTPAEIQTAYILEEVRRTCRSGEPWFVLGHYCDPHVPYLSPPVIADGSEREASVADYYLAEVQRVDRALGELFAELDDLGLYDRALILLTSDHGEELVDRRGPQYPRKQGHHGHTLFQDLLHVPLLVKLPGSRLAGTVRDEAVSGIDLAPTILSLLDLPVPDSFRGWSLFEDRAPEEYAERVLLAEAIKYGAEQKAVMRDALKVIVPQPFERLGAASVFDLSCDPLERQPAAFVAEDPRLVKAAKVLLAHLKQTRLARMSLDEPEATEGTNPALGERLRALGYVE